MHTQAEIHKKGKARNRIKMIKNDTKGVIIVIKKGILPEIAGEGRETTIGIGETERREREIETETEMTALGEGRGRAETIGTVKMKCD